MSYPSNLTDQEWELIKDFFNCGKYGNQSVHEKRELVNAVLYLTKTGCQWRQLPNDFPNWSTVHTFFRRARLKGTWQAILESLVKKDRVKMGRNPNPSFAIIDSQSSKTTSASEDRGIDGGKKIKGRKRHIVIDTQGHLLHVKVHAANVHDTIMGYKVFEQALEKYPSLKGALFDAGYRGTTVDYIRNILGKIAEVSSRITDSWVILPMRWVVERTLAWLNGSRRLSKDYEISISSEENFIIIAHSMILLRRLA